MKNLITHKSKTKDVFFPSKDCDLIPMAFEDLYQLEEVLGEVIIKAINFIGILIGCKKMLSDKGPILKVCC
jgi:hypothetical protein